MTNAYSAFLVATICWLAAAAHADDWPQWRGPMRDGVWRETGILNAFPSNGLKVCWRARIGPGYSGVVVAQGRLFISDCELKPQSLERLLCFDAATGKPLWSYSYPCDYETSTTTQPFTTTCVASRSPLESN